MAKKKNTGIAIPTLNHSWELWTALTHLGLDQVYYDREFLSGSTSFDGLGQQLGLHLTKGNIVTELKKHKISVERFIDAFFKTLQPYAEMMNDLCVFFADHQVSSTNERLQVVFDFKHPLSFDAAVFRSTLATFKTVKRKLTIYHLEDFWGLLRPFRGHLGADEKLQNSAAQRWKTAYENGQYNSPDLPDFDTAFPDLDPLLNRTLTLWKNYVEFIRTISTDVNTVKDFVRKANWPDGETDRQNQVLSNDDLQTGWSDRSLIAEMDNWAANMITSMYSTVEHLKSEPASAPENAAELTKALTSFFKDMPETEIEDTIKELVDLLNLPVWKKRYELYSTWILSGLDKVFLGYNRTLHHDKGVLLLRFKGTHLMTISTATGPLQLWAENRTPAGIKLTGHGRKNGIQPDYTIYRPAMGDPNNCIACVEVKQYKKASAANFRNAINDYAHGLPNAEIFLVNYGPVPATLPLDFPARSTYFGVVKPRSPELTQFKNDLLTKMPAPRLLTSQEKMQVKLENPTIDHLFVDVSGSMDQPERRKYLQVLLTNLLRDKQILKLSAADATNTYTWSSPDGIVIKDLLLSHFYGGADFDPSQLSGVGDALVITDQSHAQTVCSSGNYPLLIVLDKEEAELYVYDEDSSNFICQGTEPLLSIFNDGWPHAGFAGMLRPE